MRWFEIVRVSCEGCGKLQDPDRWPGRCPGCARARFRAEIDRSASGLEAFELVDFIRGTSSDGPGNPCWRTQTFLTCSGVSGDEIAEFCGAGMDERRRMYVAWKRRELEAALTPDRAACGRCGVIFKAYDNAWNRSGFCSRSCGNAKAKSRKAAE